MDLVKLFHLVQTPHTIHVILQVVMLVIQLEEITHKQELVLQVQLIIVILAVK